MRLDDRSKREMGAGKSPQNMENPMSKQEVMRLRNLPIHLA